MNLSDFLFSFKQTLIRDLRKRNYFKFFRKLFNYPYKYLLDKIRYFIPKKKINLDKSKKLERLELMSLNDLFVKFNADKASIFILNKTKITGHNYTPFYEKYFSRFKSVANLKILEIGSLRGAATASFFFFFQNPNIICADINPFQLEVYSKNIRKIFVDTQSTQSLSDLNNYLNEEFDIIIDDASHNIRDQAITFNVFFNSLKKGGVYVIEDASQYLESKNLNPDNLTFGIKEILISITQKNPIGMKYMDDDTSFAIEKNIKNIFCEQGNYVQNNVNISEIVFVEKK